MRLLAVVALMLVLVGPAAALPGTRSTPNPCALLTTPVASAYLGAPAKGFATVSRSNARHCLYIASTGRLDLEIGSRSQWVSADPAMNPPGTVVKAEPQLGENGELVYNTRKAYRIALAAFEHGAYYYTVDSQLLSAAKILALAEMVHKKVAG